MKNRIRKGLETGFTLLEVVIALAIMTVAFGSILAVEGGAINASARAKQMNVVAMLAKNKMVETEFKIQNKTFEEVPKEEAGSFEVPYEDYTWRAAIKEIKFPPLTALVPPASGDSSGNGQSNQVVERLSKLMTQHLSKSLREVTVTVAWKQGTKEQTYDLSTFWVDLNHDFSLSE